MHCKHIAHCVSASKFEGCNISLMLYNVYTMLYKAPCAVYSALYTGWDVQMVKSPLGLSMVEAESQPAVENVKFYGSILSKIELNINNVHISVHET